MFDRLRRWFSSSSKPSLRKPPADPWGNLDARPLSLAAQLQIANHRMSEAEIRQRAREIGRKLTEGQDSAASVWASTFVDPFDLVADNADFFPGVGPGGYGVSPFLNNQMRGDVLPVYINEYGLKLIRDWSRRTLAFNEFAINAVENRISYIVGKGFVYSVNPKKKPESSEEALGEDEGSGADSLARKAQAVLDEFIDRERWNEREQECVRRCDRDGEAIVRFFHVGNGRSAVRFVEPECLTSLTGGVDRLYGIVTEPGDIENVTHYSIVENPSAGWVTVDVPADRVLHIKANTDFDAKRGLPTLFPVRKNLERADKLLRNMSVMAQVQATFAVLRKHKQFAPSAVSAYQQAQGDLNTVVPVSGRSLQMQQLLPGSIIDTSDKTEYEFPAAGVNAAGLVDVLNAELRAVASRMCLSEYMLTADASNGNFSSLMVAESNIVKGMERMQCWFARRFGDGEYGRRDVGGGQLVGAMWRVLAIAVDAGLLPREVLTDLEIQVEPPSLVVRNKVEETNRAKTLRDAGILSDETWAKWEGLDLAQERQQGAKPQGGAPGGGVPPPTAAPEEGSPPGSADGMEVEPFGESVTEEIRHVFGKCVDTGTHKTVPCPTGPAKGGVNATPKAAPDKATAELNSKVEAKLKPEIEALEKTPEGKAALSKGKAVAAKVKEKIASGVKEALAGLDDESGGGVSFLGGALKHGLGGAKSLKHGDVKSAAVLSAAAGVEATAGVARLTGTVFRCIHEEVFELMLSQQTHGPAFVAKIAAKVGAKGAMLAQSGVLKGVAWAWGKLKGISEAIEMIEAEGGLTGADKALLAKLATVAADALREVYAAAGADDVEIDEAKLAAKIAASLGA